MFFAEPAVRCLPPGFVLQRVFVFALCCVCVCVCNQHIDATHMHHHHHHHHHHRHHHYQVTPRQPAPPLCNVQLSGAVGAIGADLPPGVVLGRWWCDVHRIYRPQRGRWRRLLRSALPAAFLSELFSLPTLLLLKVRVLCAALEYVQDTATAAPILVVVWEGSVNANGTAAGKSTGTMFSHRLPIDDWCPEL